MTGRAALVAISVAAAALATACTGPGPATANRSRAPARTTVTVDQGTVDHGMVRHLRYRYLTDLPDGAVARDYGYDLVDLGPYRAAVDALPAGERALVWIGGYSLADCAFDLSDADVRQALAGLARDPKVAGYYLADEADDALPAYGGHCPHVAAQITQRSRLVHALAPGVFTYEVVTEPGNFAAFARATDVMGADPYPCLRGRSCDWAQIPAYIAALNAAHVPRYWASAAGLRLREMARADGRGAGPHGRPVGAFEVAGGADVRVELPGLVAGEPSGPARRAETSEPGADCVVLLRLLGVDATCVSAGTPESSGGSPTMDAHPEGGPSAQDHWELLVPNRRRGRARGGCRRWPGQYQRRGPGSGQRGRVLFGCELDLRNKHSKHHAGQ